MNIVKICSLIAALMAVCMFTVFALVYMWDVLFAFGIVAGFFGVLIAASP